MIPESHLIKSEITLRELILTDDVKIARKSLIRWIALSMGLIHPNESRYLLLDILDVLLSFHVKKENPTTQQIIDSVNGSRENKSHPKAIYYHLLRLKQRGFIIRKKGRYSLIDGSGRRLSELFRDFYFSRSADTFKNIDEALKRLEESYKV